MKKSAISRSQQSVKFLFLILLFIGFSQQTFAFVQQEDSFKEYKGTVIDNDTKKPLVFADITIVSTNIGTITNKEGKFSLKVPLEHQKKSISISYLGYQTKVIELISLNNNNKISLVPVATELGTVNISAPKDAKTLVLLALDGSKDSYEQSKSKMIAFYRETIKKGRKNASLAEAVINIEKQPYNKSKRDNIELLKSRKSTNYSRLDTIALKLQGGPYSALYSDNVKYPKFVFSQDFFQYYNFSFSPSTQINDRHVYVVDFKQQPNVVTPLYYGKLFIDAETHTLVSAVYQLNMTNKNEVVKLFVKRKPSKVKVEPLEAIYRVDYRLNDGKWHFSYSNLQLSFRVKYRKKLFGSNYTLNVEMAVTDWKKNNFEDIDNKNKISRSIILTDEASGFSDPEFWGKYNIIEPEKSIESAIKKISKQLKRIDK